MYSVRLVHGSSNVTVFLYFCCPFPPKTFVEAPRSFKKFPEEGSEFFESGLITPSGKVPAFSQVHHGGHHNKHGHQKEDESCSSLHRGGFFEWGGLVFSCSSCDVVMLCPADKRLKYPHKQTVYHWISPLIGRWRQDSNPLLNWGPPKLELMAPRVKWWQ